MKNEDSFANLYKKMDATSRTRFYASRRLRLHAKSSTYTVVIISLGLILISLMQAYELGNNIDSNLVGLIQIFSAVAVLVYSLLIETNNFSSLSEKMYSCASKLGELKIRFYPYLDKDHDENIYNKFSDEYYSILKLYETHSSNYSKGDYIRATLEMPENYQIKGKNRLLVYSQLILHYAIDFLSYPLVILFLSSVLFWLWFGDIP